MPLGSARVAASAPVGDTLLAGSMGSHVAAPVLAPNLKYNPSRDFEPIGFTAHSPAVIIARRDFPAKDFAQFTAYLKQHGDQVRQAHGGIGASSHMACLLFTSELGVKPTLVAYRGTGPAVNDLIGGHVDFLCEQSVSVAGRNFIINDGVVRCTGEGDVMLDMQCELLEAIGINVAKMKPEEVFDMAAKVLTDRELLALAEKEIEGSVLAKGARARAARAMSPADRLRLRERITGVVQFRSAK